MHSLSENSTLTGILASFIFLSFVEKCLIDSNDFIRIQYWVIYVISVLLLPCIYIEFKEFQTEEI